MCAFTKSNLVTLPLGGADAHTSACASLVDLLGEHGLVSAHGNREGAEVVQAVGETHSAGVDEHSLVAADLGNLKAATALHGRLKTGEQVLADAEWPAVADGGDSLHVLVDETVDLLDSAGTLDHLPAEEGEDGLAAKANARGGLGHDAGHAAEGDAKVADGDKGLLGLATVVVPLEAGGDAVGLEGHVVVRNLLAVAVHSGEHLIGSTLDLG